MTKNTVSAPAAATGREKISNKFGLFKFVCLTLDCLIHKICIINIVWIQFNTLANYSKHKGIDRGLG